MREAQLQIVELEKEIQRLNRAVVGQENYKTQNAIYQDAFAKISETVKDPKRIRDIERAVN